jgi:hypothetical protein
MLADQSSGSGHTFALEQNLLVHGQGTDNALYYIASRQCHGNEGEPFNRSSCFRTEIRPLPTGDGVVPQLAKQSYLRLRSCLASTSTLLRRLVIIRALMPADSDTRLAETWELSLSMIPRVTSLIACQTEWSISRCNGGHC